MFPWAVATAAINIGAGMFTKKTPDVGLLATLQMVSQLKTINATLIDINNTLIDIHKAVKDLPSELSLEVALMSGAKSHLNLERIKEQISSSEDINSSSLHFRRLTEVYGTGPGQLAESLHDDLSEYRAFLERHSDKDFVLVALSYPIIQLLTDLLYVSGLLIEPDVILAASVGNRQPTSHGPKLKARHIGEHIGDLKVISQFIDFLLDGPDSLFAIFEKQHKIEISKYADSKYEDPWYPDQELYSRYQSGEQLSIDRDLDGFLANDVYVSTYLPIVFKRQLPFQYTGSGPIIDKVLRTARLWTRISTNKLSLYSFTEAEGRGRPRHVELGPNTSFNFVFLNLENKVDEEIDEKMIELRDEPAQLHFLDPISGDSSKFLTEIRELGEKYKVEYSLDFTTESQIEFLRRASDFMSIDEEYFKTTSRENMNLASNYLPLGHTISFEDRAIKVTELVQIRAYMENFKRGLWAVRSEIDRSLSQRT